MNAPGRARDDDKSDVNPSGHLPSVRLAGAGLLSMALLAWIGFVPGSTPSLPDFTCNHPVRIVISTLFALFILVTLAPVLGRGPKPLRWLALLLCLFPFVVLGVTGFWLDLMF